MNKEKFYPKILVEPPGPIAKNWLERDEKVLAGVNMVYTPGLITARGDGCFITDPDGNVFIDFCQSRATEGHSNPKIIKALEEYVKKEGLTGGVYTTTKRGAKAELSEKLLSVMSGKLKTEGKVSYCNSGTESCDYAISMARQELDRSVIIAFKGAYHGMTGSAMMASSWKGIKKKHFAPLITDTLILPYAYCYRCSFKQVYPECGLTCVEYIRTLFDDVLHPDDVAGIIVEPLMGHAGFIPPPPEYFMELRKLCDEIGALFIADEVYTGFGKSGKMFAIEHYNTEPDLYALGKPLGAAGFNLACVVGPGEIMDRSWLVNSGAFSSGGSPLACAMALRKLELLLEENWMENAEKVGAYMMNRLKEMQEKFEIMGDVRGKGLLIGVELVRDRKTKEPAYKEGQEIEKRLFKKGVVGALGGTTANPTLKISTALVITEEIAGAGLDKLEECFKEIQV